MSQVLPYIYLQVTFPGILGNGSSLKSWQKPEKPSQKLTDWQTENLTLEPLQSCNPIHKFIKLS